MTKYYAVCQDDSFWNAASWTTSDGTVITTTTERDAYYISRYASLQLWDDNEAGDIGEPVTCEILGTWATQDVILSLNGWNNSYLNWITITAVGVARHSGTWTNTAYRIVNTSASHAINVRENYVVIDGIQVSSSDIAYDAISLYGYASFMTIQNSIITGGGKNGIYHGSASGNGGITTINNLVYDMYECGIRANGNLAKSNNHINNTVYGCNISGNGYRSGIYDNSTYGKAINCVSMDNNAYDFYGCVKYRCLSSDATASGNNGIINQVSGDVFTDYTNDDYSIPSTSNARDVGTKLYNAPNTDIIGVYRDTYYDIGAFEYDTGYVPVAIVNINIENMIEGSAMTLEETDGTVIIAPAIVDSTGTITKTYNYTSDVNVILKVRESSTPVKYLPFRMLGVITASGLNMYVSQIEDTVAI